MTLTFARWVSMSVNRNREMKEFCAIAFALLITAGCSADTDRDVGRTSNAALDDGIAVELDRPVIKDNSMIFQVTVTNSESEQVCISGAPIRIVVLSDNLDYEIRDYDPNGETGLVPGSVIEPPATSLEKSVLPRGSTSFEIVWPPLIEPYFVTPKDVYVRDYLPHEFLRARAHVLVFDCNYDIENDALGAGAFDIVASAAVGPFRLNDDVVITLDEYYSRLE
jgi:hypothetical protein